MKVWSISILLLCLTAGMAQSEPVPATGPVTSVIVYRGQALVTRSLTIPRAGGEMELLVENLPEKILPESLYAQSDGTFSVLSVRYRERVVREDTRQEVTTLQQQIEAVRRDIQNRAYDIENVGDRTSRYREQWKLSVDSANADLNRGILQPEAVRQLTEFLEHKSIELHKETVRLANEKQDLEKRLAELEKELSALAQGRQKVNRQALVYITRGENTSGQILLSYLVRDANWQPQYNLRAAADRNKVTVEYNAVVHQASGEDWLNAQLALSTAEPTMVSAPPGLSPMKVTLGAGAQAQQRALQQGMPAVGISADAEAFVSQSDVFESLARSRADNIAKGIKAELALNTIAIRNQMIELEADRRTQMAMQARAAVVRNTEGVSVLYALAGKLSLPSRTEQQILSIASFDCPAEFVFVASPLLTDYVYLQADIANTSETILLPGPASMFRNGEFVGRSEMKLVTSGQTFVASFGIDSQIQVVREFTDTRTDVQLGSRTSEQHYRIALSNYKSNPVALRVLDRIPWTENRSLSIALKETSHPLSDAADYVRTEKPKGILRWDMELAPNTSGATETVLTYVYTMQYDKSLSVVSAGQ